jgi:alpha-glucosidase
MIYRQILMWFLVAVLTDVTAQTDFLLDSPSRQLQLTIKVTDSVYYSLKVDGAQTLSESAIALVTNVPATGSRRRPSDVRRRSVNDTIINRVPYKRKLIPDHYNELTLEFRQYAVVFRAYDDGIAWRFITSLHDSIEVIDEVASFRFAQADTVYFSQVEKRGDADTFHTSFEEGYTKLAIGDIRPSQLSYSPVLVNGAVKCVITESDLWDYPGMFLRGSGGKALRGVFAPYPAAEEIHGGEFRQPVVVARENYIATTAGSRAFPWRVIVVARRDAELPLNDLVYRLATPAANADWSWVKPGISTEEWICGINLHHVDFKAGINTASYKYYIDFASRFGMQYVMLDAGWSDYNDLFSIREGLDLKELAAYAERHHVGLILWTLSMTLDRQLEEALRMFQSLGIKAIMTDFMDRDDQKMMRFYKRVADATAKHKIMVMFHGACKNAGFERTYPHAIAREAVLGSEYNIWSDEATPEHDVTIPFIRMVAGPMDYEPGFYENVNQATFRPLADHVMSQGTRCHQLAMFVAYDNPLEMFSGNPSDALMEQAYTAFLLSIPTTWDETRIPDARLGDYLVTARKKGNDWYVSAMTDWTAREVEVDLSFLGPGEFTASICEDGINASRHSGDYSFRTEKVDRSDKLKVRMAAGGGFVAKIIKDNE